MFKCECGNKYFTAYYQEDVVGTASVNGEYDVLDTYHEECINFEFTGDFACDECGERYDSLEEDHEGQSPEEQLLKEKTDRYLRTGGVKCLICQ